MSSSLEVGELSHHSLAVGLELGRLVELGHESLAAGVRGVHDEVADPGSHDEVAHANIVATNELAAVALELALNNLVEFATDGDESCDVLVLLVGWSEEDGGGLAEDISPGVDDGVVVHGALPVLGVVVAKPDGEHAHDGTELTKVVDLAAGVEINLGKTTSELATIACSLLGFPSWGSVADLLVLLTVVLEHLSDRVGAAVEAIEVLEFDALGHGVLALGGGGTGLLSGWLRSASVR